MKNRIPFVLLAGVCLASLSAAALGAQAPTSVTAGVYTAEQAKRGATIYAENCAACHGESLTGNDPIPALAGSDFVSRWKSVGELFDKTNTSMPATAPGSLTPAQVADVIAHTLAVNKFPAGSVELGSKVEELNGIKIEFAK
jgi:S-disulfanyl-L-cysteine oxidoreductase SoxD